MKEMMKKVRERREGFTMAELLIVVAIIAVLVAIAIPVFTSQLAKANAGVDAANIRSGYADAQTKALTNDDAVAFSEGASSATLYLKKDGTVTTSKTDLYETKGESSKLDDGTTIGGFVVNAASGNAVSWTAEKNIQYTIVKNADNLLHVSKIEVVPTT